MTKQRPFEIYKELRDNIDRLKEEVGFKCRKCGSCCTQNIPIFFEDYYYMKDNYVSLDGLSVSKNEKGVLYRLKMHSNKGELTTGICFYEDQDNKKCSIHPYNPLTCHSFPFVCNLDNFKVEDVFFVHKSCSWMEENFDKFFIMLEQREQVLELIRKFREAQDEIDYYHEDEIKYLRQDF